MAVLRIGLGVDFVAHGAQKLFGAWHGPGLHGTSAFFASLGAHPGMFWAWSAGLVEFGGGIAMLLGLFVRLAGVGLAVDMILAVALFNWDHGFFTEKPADGWEINLILFCMAVTVAVVGPGRLAAATLVRRGPHPLARLVAQL